MTVPAALGIVLVNWNRWADTLECLESVLRSTLPVEVVVVDNGSTDGSLDRFEAWASGGEAAPVAAAGMARFSQPPLPKPIAYRRLAAGARDAPDPAVRLTFIDAGRNGGFAAGNNVGLAYLLRRRELDAFWLLNNDTVAAPEAAAAIVARMAATDRIGMCGTVVRFYHRPDTVQALNGSRFNVWTGQSRGLGFRQPAAQPFDPRRIAEATDFVLGASLAVSRAFLEAIGPMDEGYFLYFEEADWAARNDGRFRIGFAHGATVWHKEGGSIGSSGVAGQRSNLSEYWLNRSRLRFIRRHHPWLLPWHWLVTLALMLRRLARGQARKAAAIGRALAGLRY